MNAEKEMSFLEHLEELRWHIVRSILSIVILGIIVFIYIQWVFDHILYAPKKASFLTYKVFCALSERTCFEAPALEIITVSLDEQFLTAIKVAFWLGFIGSFPYIFYQFWKFIKPGLYDKEKKAVKGVVWICSLLFISGVLFGYFIIAPFAIKFLGTFTVGMEISNTVSLKSYIGYMTMFTIPAGILFELPIVIFFLSKIGIVTPKFLRHYRRHAYISILILAAIITPPDVATQFMIGIPVFFLYEISIFISARVQKNSMQIQS
ncbi:MAG TPA: twin-arginine translocase subunit TatC [Saprospiraceae bacterium]|nr:twin-arginine translocase subunit TatC [Saprospiraceae bacterium]